MSISLGASSPTACDPLAAPDRQVDGAGELPHVAMPALVFELEWVDPGVSWLTPLSRAWARFRHLILLENLHTYLKDAEEILNVVHPVHGWLSTLCAQPSDRQ